MNKIQNTIAEQTQEIEINPVITEAQAPIQAIVDPVDVNETVPQAEPVITDTLVG